MHELIFITPFFFIGIIFLIIRSKSYNDFKLKRENRKIENSKVPFKKGIKI